MNPEIEKQIRKNQTAALFINTTQEMIDLEGLEKISIRKIAEQAGYHNSTIYLHFKDLDELLMLASMKHFHSYSQALEELSNQTRSPRQIFLAVWDLFFTTIFQKPDIFYNFFFGKHSNNLQQIMNTYYQIFPEERRSFSRQIESMYFGNNIQERSLRILEPLIYETSAVTEENLLMINDITVACCKYKLEQKCKNKELDSDELKTQLIAIIMHICGLRE